ncbi:CidA/LrgA family protein [Pokkaliibacter sp. MBI-7]|uniref:CidA/LrgA family protein n=1 Tax=Pokkaliibacter sp. MBI-7 TaxID=3040600 RepID=UPI00244CF1F2|nr:CidA/LrgA family protein [Pokkaliibacter sp. MBI-7]MDH2435903.1 CidA/LrgA family protein [Pokkaliibacter sp. MBI-7]
MLGGFVILLGCQLIGELLVRSLDLPFPSPVVGMILLLVGLMINGEVPSGLRLVAEGLLKHLSLLFVPAGVGLMVHFRLIQADWLSIALALVISSVLTIVIASLVMGRMMGKGEEGKHGPAD